MAGDSPAAPTAAFAVLVLLVLALQFAPMIGLIGFRLTDIAEWSYAGVTRDAAAVLLMGLALLAWWGSGGTQRLPASALWALAMVACYGLLALANTGGLVLTMLNLRRLVLVPLLFVAVLLIPWTSRQIDAAFRWLAGSTLVVVVFGFIEWLSPDALWTEAFEVEAYTAANNLDRFGQLPFAESGRFFTSDLQSLVGHDVRRMVSTYLEPTTLAAALATWLVLLLARQARGHASLPGIAVALLAGAATVSKGFALFTLVLLAWRMFGVPTPRQVGAVLMGGCVVAVLAARFDLEGPLSHVRGLVTGLQFLAAGRWLGEGIGAAGNLSDLGSEIGEESGLGNVIAQVGVVAVLSMLWLRALARDVLGAAAARRDPGGPWIASWLLFWAVTYLFSASSLGVAGNALGFIVMALYLHPASGRLPPR